MVPWSADSYMASHLLDISIQFATGPKLSFLLPQTCSSRSLPTQKTPFMLKAFRSLPAHIHQQIRAALPSNLLQNPVTSHVHTSQVQTIIVSPRLLRWLPNRSILNK